MVWHDRDYNQESFGRGGGGGGGGYLANPLSAMSISVPFGNWFGARVRLHFWLLISFLFIIAGLTHGASPAAIAIHITLFIAAILLHEFGHRITASIVGGHHNEMMLWPAGGMIPPTCPSTPLAYFVTHAGGIAMNILISGICGLGVWFLTGIRILPSVNPLAIFEASVPLGQIDTVVILTLFAILNTSVAFVAILPFYWFDGAPILQSILWPWTGVRLAINVTCIIGMVLATPMFFLSVAGANLFGMIFWALLFASSYSKRRDLKFSGLEEEITYANTAALSHKSSRTKKPHKSLLARIQEKRTAAKTQELEAQVDIILAKVAENGMHSLTEHEKRTLERASRELRDRR